MCKNNRLENNAACFKGSDGLLPISKAELGDTPCSWNASSLPSSKPYRFPNERLAGWNYPSVSSFRGLKASLSETVQQVQ